MLFKILREMYWLYDDMIIFYVFLHDIDRQIIT